jgi:hypothetical protein
LHLHTKPTRRIKSGVQDIKNQQEASSLVCKASQRIKCVVQEIKNQEEVSSLICKKSAHQDLPSANYVFFLLKNTGGFSTSPNVLPESPKSCICLPSFNQLLMFKVTDVCALSPLRLPDVLQNHVWQAFVVIHVESIQSQK